MGLLDRLLSRNAPQVLKSEAITLHAGALIEVVGESYRQDALGRIATIGGVAVRR